MPRIGVVGAGIGGVAVALSLAKAGCEVRLFERAASLGEAGAGVQLSSNAVLVLRRLGVLEAVERTAVTVTGLTIGRGRDAAVLARLPLGRAEERYGSPFLVTLRSDLHRALLDAVESNRSITLETGREISGWTTAHERLVLAFATGPADDVALDGLVGADGLHSRVRHRMNPSDRAISSGRTAWRSLIDTAALPALFAEPCSNIWMGSAAHLVHYPVAAGGRVNVVAALDDPSGSEPPRGLWSSPGDPREIRRHFARWAPPLRTLIEAAPSWTRWPLADRAPLPSWSAGPVTLLGDAAHPMLPFLAQGAAQALEDAAVLGDAVAGSRGDIASAFRRYEAARKPRTDRVQAASRRQRLIYHLSGPAAWARDLVLSTTPSERLLARYDWLYSHDASMPS